MLQSYRGLVSDTVSVLVSVLGLVGWESGSWRQSAASGKEEREIHPSSQENGHRLMMNVTNSLFFFVVCCCCCRFEVGGRFILVNTSPPTQTTSRLGTPRLFRAKVPKIDDNYGRNIVNIYHFLIWCLYKCHQIFGGGGGIIITIRAPVFPILLQSN